MTNASFTESQLVNVKQQFKAMDFDNDGLISEAEFTQALKNTSRNPEDYEIQKFFSDSDKNKDGKITFTEFVEACENLGLSSSISISGKPTLKGSQEVDAIFRNFDRDGDGSITANELTEALKGQGESVTETDVEEMIDAADKNHDHKVDREEFGNMI